CDALDAPATYGQVINLGTGQPTSVNARADLVLEDVTDQVKSPKSWEFSFSATGIPLAARPSEKTLSNPVVTWVKSSSIDHANLTSDRITGTGDTATLTPSGSRYVQLITDAF
ncbi:MAG: hypothetical protein ABL994_17960, partial [Verrucomicrobiales bacterium]